MSVLFICAYLGFFAGGYCIGYLVGELKGFRKGCRYRTLGEQSHERPVRVIYTPQHQMKCLTCNSYFDPELPHACASLEQSERVPSHA